MSIGWDCDQFLSNIVTLWPKYDDYWNKWDKWENEKDIYHNKYFQKLESQRRSAAQRLIKLSEMRKKDASYCNKMPRNLQEWKRRHKKSGFMLMTGDHFDSCVKCKEEISSRGLSQ